MNCSVRKWELLTGALVIVVATQALQLPAIAGGSMTFLSGELTFFTFGVSDPALSGTEAHQRIQERPSSAGRERLSVYIALRRIAVVDLSLDVSSGLSPNVVRAVSRVPLTPIDSPVALQRGAPTVEGCGPELLGVDAQISYRIVLSRRSIAEVDALDGVSLVAFRQDGEEWIVDRRCLNGR